MADPAVIHDTFTTERRYARAPAEVFAVLTDPARKRRWYAGEDAEFSSDFRLGGEEVSRSRLGDDTPFPGALLSAENRYLDIVADRRIVMSSVMSLGGHRMSVSMLTFEVVAEPAGARLVFTCHTAFFENSDGPDRRRGGWGAILDRLDGEVAA